MKRAVFSFRALIIFTFFVTGMVCGCSASATGGNEANRTDATNRAENVNVALKDDANKGASIKIAAGSPSETVRAFYNDLREKKFREALYLTNLRPAIEGLTDSELKDFNVDFEAIAGQIPAVVEINGEIVTGDNATVTAKLPGEDGDKLEVQKIDLRRENGVWIILTVDGDAEKRIKAEGKNYFYNLRIETHHEEARRMLDRVSKAEIAYSQTQGKLGEFKQLIEASLLPPDILSPASTGYNYTLTLAPDGKSYTVSAVPAEYGKSGKLSFWVELVNGQPHLDGKDNGGKPLK